MGETKVGGRACGAAQSSDYLRLDTPGMPRACCKVDVHGATLVHSGELAFAEYGRRSDSHGSLLTQLVGIFLFGITCLFLVIQLKAPDAKPFAWLSQGVGWSSCLVLNLMNEEKGKKPDWYIAVVVCAFCGIGFLASALFRETKVGGRAGGAAHSSPHVKKCI